MHSYTLFICLFLAYNVNTQDCSCGIFPPNLPGPLKHLLNPLPVPPCYTCGCPDPSRMCGSNAPIVPPCGCFNPAIGLPNPILNVQTCACSNSFGTCTCGSPVLGNLCGCTTPTVGLTTTCGCSDPAVRIVDGCPRCQNLYSYNLPSIGYPTCGCTAFGGVVAPSFLPPCGCGACGSCGALGLYGSAPCGCAAPCSCGGCGCGGISPCGCGGISPCGCAPVNSCGCVEVPCGLPKVKTTCTCVTPTIETPYGCAQGQPTCACATTLEMPTCGVPVVPPFAPVVGCSRYLRQVCMQPPFL